MSQYRYHPLIEAARNNDAIAEEHGLRRTIEILGLDLDAVMHAASQRALRATLLVSRGEEGMKAVTQNGNAPVVVPMNPDEMEMMQSLTIACLDAICVGWKGREISDNEAKEAEAQKK